MEIRNGTKVYFEEPYSGRIIKGTAKTMTSDGTWYISGQYTVNETGRHITEINAGFIVNPKNAYPTVRQAYAAKRTAHEKLVEKYCSQITDTKSLAEFPLRNSFGAGEYTDYAAIEAYKKSMKRILGYDMSNIQI